jgi:hypothetical protein
MEIIGMVIQINIIMMELMEKENLMILRNKT